MKEWKGTLSRVRSQESLSLALFIAALLIGLSATLPALSTIRESLWIDELHTSWVILGPWSELASRAASGNQNVLYFALLKLMQNVLPATEWGLRLPSLLAWGGAFGVSFLVVVSAQGRQEMVRRGAPFFVALVAILACWGCLDWVSWFHAIEARPYAFLLLMTSLLLLFVDREEAKARRPFHFAWSLLACGMVWIHATAGLVVVASWIARLCHSLSARPSIENSDPTAARSYLLQNVAFRFGEAGLLVLGWLPLLTNARSIYSRRTQWQSFAGDASVLSLIQNYPLIAWGIIPAVAWFGCRYWIRCIPSTTKGAKQDEGRESTRPYLHLILVAIVPIFLAWLSTYAGWMPLMHRRYLLGSHIALFVLGGSLLLGTKKLRWLLIAGLLSTTALVVQQGNWKHWQEGEWMGWQRGEMWDEAIDYLNHNGKPGDHVYLVPMLVETRRLPFPPLPHADYLKFPVHGLYPLDTDLTLDVLSSSLSEWNLDWPTQPMECTWILVRTSEQGVAPVLKAIRKRAQMQAESISFGRVQLIQVKVAQSLE